MCTVTYIPGKNGFNLTSNRDEHISRAQAAEPEIYSTNNSKLLYPKDPDKNGSWIAAKNTGDLVVLLNGAFVKHTVRPGYKKSRGLILIDIIKAESPADYYKEMDLEDIEPFTLVLYSSGILYECRWDGEKKSILILNKNLSYIWSSATLYDKTAAVKRNSWFNDWLNSSYPDSAGAIGFHKYGGEGDPKDALIINRDGNMRTMSITNIHSTPEGVVMTYEDLKDNKQYVKQLVTETPVKADQ